MSEHTNAGPRVIDTHVHIWDLTGGIHGTQYPWLAGAPELLRRTHTFDELIPELDAAGVDGVVLVQAADDLAETHALLHAARAADRPTKVVGWLPLADGGAAVEALQQLPDLTQLAGVRHLIHDEPDREWMLRGDVADGMRVLESAGLTFDAVAERPDLIAQLPTVARRHPELTIVLDHLGKPPIADGGWQPWADLVADAAAESGVVAKISGLGTMSAPGWTAADWQRYVDHALECFGPDRLMLGGDWPVALLAGGYADTWAATLESISALTSTEQAAILGGTARRVYRFDS